jgi:hypothetical protein
VGGTTLGAAVVGPVGPIRGAIVGAVSPVVGAVSPVVGPIGGPIGGSIVGSIVGRGSCVLLGSHGQFLAVGGAHPNRPEM